MGFLDRFSPQLLSALRIVSALLFIAHGTTKLFGFPPTEMFATPPAPMTLMWFAGVLEAFGGALLLLGLFTRPVAFVLSGMMAVAYWMAHAPQSVYPVQNGGDAAILFCFVFLYIAAAGPGPWALDHALFRKKA
ncbi:MAG: DoxX family protein [Hyphomonadaceae bacterium]|nr:DoxX family protein [Hyphomonadaceae bacterium]